MTVGSGGCSMSNGEIKITNNNISVSSTTSIPSSATGGATTNSSTIQSVLKNITYYLNGNKIIHNIQSIPRNRIESYDRIISTSSSILIDTNLTPNTQYYCELIAQYHLGTDTFAIIIGSIISKVDSNGNLYRNIPANMHVYVDNSNSGNYDIPLYDITPHYAIQL